MMTVQMIKDTKTYRPEELEEILEIPNHTLYAWLRYAIPNGLMPKKVYHEELGRKVYQFTDKERKTLMKVKELKHEGLTYAEIKERLGKFENVINLKEKEDDPVDKMKKAMKNHTELILSEFESQKEELFKCLKLVALTMGISASIFILIVAVLTKLS